MARCVSFPNIGYLIDDVPTDLIAYLKNEISELDDNAIKANNKLAGNIRKEFKLTHSIGQLEPYLFSLIAQYDKEFNYLKSINCLTSDLPFTLNDLWVNKQQKHEFNPNHNHSGIMSFVIWLQIPYTNEEERAASPGKYSRHDCSGKFEFSFTNVLGSIWNETIPVDKSYEGKIILFPNSMIHCVYPFFSSDELRISVAGNVHLRSS